MAIFRLKSMSGHDCECCVGFKLETLLWPLLVSAIWMSWYQVQEVHRGLQWLFVWGGTLQGGYSWRNLAPKQPSLCWYLSYFLVTLVIGIGAQNDSWGQATAGPTFEIISRVCFRAWFVVFKSFGRLLCSSFLYHVVSWGTHDIPLGPILARLTPPIMVIAFAVPLAVNALPFIMSELDHI